MPKHYRYNLGGLALASGNIVRTEQPANRATHDWPWGYFADDHRQEYSRADAQAVCDMLNQREQRRGKNVPPGFRFRDMRPAKR